MAAKKKSKALKAKKSNELKDGRKKYKAPRQIFLTLNGNGVESVTGTFGKFKDAKDTINEGSPFSQTEQVVGPYILAERVRHE